MIVYRLGKEIYKDDLSGKGAEKAGGRWNSKGVAMVYAAQSRALCTAEIAVRTPLGILPDHYYLTSIDIPDSIPVWEYAIKDLPPDWKSYPHPNSTQLIGDKFISEGQYLVMKVPSATVQGDFNFLINPAHPEIKSVKITQTELFEFDKRLFVK